MCFDSKQNDSVENRHSTMHPPFCSAMQEKYPILKTLQYDLLDFSSPAEEI
jgi:hypothetical protein